MKVGDLVKMKYRLFWVTKTNNHLTYTKSPAVVLEVFSNAVKVLYTDGKIKSDLKESFDVINETL